jgi:hypothetical protein
MIDDILEERSHTHGDFKENAEAAQILKNTIRIYKKPGIELTPVQREALDNICQKIARIITGNPNHADNWLDVSGYATLALRELTNVKA